MHEVLVAIHGIEPGPSGWYRVVCPFCVADGYEGSKKKLSVNAENGYFHCWRPSCGAKGFVDLGTKFLTKKEDKKGDGTVKLPNEYIPLMPSTGALKSVALRPYFAYLNSRGLNNQIIEEAQLGVCITGEYAWKIIIPVVWQRQIVGFTARSIANKFYSNPPGFSRTKFFLNGDSILEETDEPLAIVEGPFDHLRHWPYTAACFGKPTKDQVNLLKQAKRPLVIGLDADAQMEGWGLALTLELLGKDVRFLKLNPGTDPGETPREIFLRWLLSAPKASAINPDAKQSSRSRAA